MDTEIRTIIAWVIGLTIAIVLALWLIQKPPEELPVISPEEMAELEKARQQASKPLAVGPGAPVPLVAPSGSPKAGQYEVWAFGGKVAASLWQEILANFEKETGQSSRLTVYQSRQDFDRALRAAREEGALPDLFILSAIDVEDFLKSDLIAELERPPGEGWVAKVVSAFRRGRKVMAYPSDYSVLALYYNKTIFESKMTAPPSSEWDWNSLVQASKHFFTPGEDGETRPRVYGVEIPIRFDYWNALSVQAGLGIYDGPQWMLGRDDALPAQTSALKEMRDWFQGRPYAPPPRAYSAGVNFLEGRSAMLIAGPEMISRLRMEAPQLKFGVAPLPFGVARATPLRADGWAVSLKAPNRIRAGQLALRLARQSLLQGWLPAYATPETIQPEWEVFYQSTPHGIPPLIHRRARWFESEVTSALLQYVQDPKADANDFIAQVKADHLRVTR